MVATQAPQRLPLNPASAFIALAVLQLPVLGGLVAWVAPALGRGVTSSRPSLAANHTATLLWGTLVAMGALHQMLPAAAGVSLVPGRGAAIQLGAFVLGAAILVGGFLARATLAVGGSVVAAAVLAFVWQMASILARRRRWLPALIFVVLALACLAAAVIWGLLVALNWRYRFWPALLTARTVAAHASLGLAGWFLNLILGVSYYLLPRFTAVRTHGEAGSRAALILLDAGLAGMLAWAASGAGLPGRAGVAAAGAALLVHAGDVASYLRGRRDRRRDVTVATWWAIVAVEIALAGLGAAAALGAVPAVHAAAAGGVLLVLGLVTLAIMGQLFKVTPFLMWFYRFRMGLAPAEVPRLPEPYWPPGALVPLGLTGAGVAALAASVLLRAEGLAAAGGWAFAAGTAAFSYLLGYSWIRGLRQSG